MTLRRLRKIIRSISDVYKFKPSIDEDALIVYRTDKKLDPSKLKWKVNLNDSEIKNISFIFSDSGINSQYNPRIAFYYGKELIGGITVQINKIEKSYLFDTAIKEKYQYRGLFNKIMSIAEKDARKKKMKTMTSNVVNLSIINSLENLGFKVYRESDTVYCIKNLK